MEVTPSISPSSSPVVLSPGEIDPVDLAKRKIPEFTGWDAPKKKKYLTYRVFDFDEVESAKYTDVNLADVIVWKRDDSEFRQWDEVEVERLRRELQVDISLAQFYRNLWLAMSLDGKVLAKASVEGIDSLSKQEMDYLLRIRTRYGGENLAHMLRVAVGDLSPASNINITTVFISGPGGEREKLNVAS